MNRALDALLTDWGAWRRLLESDCLGYPSRTAESRCGEGRAPNKPGALVPRVIAPERLMEADRAIRDMPAPLKLAVEVRYLLDLARPEQELAWESKTRRSRRAYYHRLESAHWWLDGRLSHVLQARRDK